MRGFLREPRFQPPSPTHPPSFQAVEAAAWGENNNFKCKRCNHCTREAAGISRRRSLAWKGAKRAHRGRPVNSVRPFCLVSIFSGETAAPRNRGFKVLFVKHEFINC